MSSRPPRRSAPVILGIALVVLATAWTFRRGENTCLIIDDNLDDGASLYRAMTVSRTLWGIHSTVPNFMGGAPRNSLPSELQFSTLLFSAIPTFDAFILQALLARIVAFVGMILLQRSHVAPGSSRIATYGAAICFALLPFFPCPFFSLCVAGQPLLAWAFLNIRAGDARARNWLVIALFPFFSFFAYSGFVVVGTMVALFFFDLSRARGRLLLDVKAIVVFGLTSVIAEYRLFYQHLLNNYVSHRVEMVPFRFESAREAVWGAMHLFVLGQFNARVFAFVVWPLVLAAILEGRPHWREWRIAASLTVVAILISLVFGFSHHATVVDFTSSGMLRGLNRFQWDRLYFVHPTVVYCALGASLALLIRRLPRLRPLFAMLVSLQAAYAFLGANHWDRVEQRQSGITFREFYSERLFARIQNHIGMPPSTFRVISVGLHPAIALYNGFYTLDGYCTDYPLSYKHRFRRIIATELVKDARNRQTFDDHGSRCYAFAAEAGDFVQRGPRRPIEHLQFDAKELRAMGGRYVLSAAEVLNFAEAGLRPDGVFSDPESAWTIHLYEVMPR